MLKPINSFEVESKQMLPSFVRPGQARNYEGKVYFDFDSPWPYRIDFHDCKVNDELLSTLTRHLDIKGVVVLPLESSFIQNASKDWVIYLCKIIGIKENNQSVEEFLEVLKNISTSKYRYANQKQSIHIPSIHGRTLYGHYLLKNLDVVKQLEPVFIHAFKAKYCSLGQCVVVSTSDLTVNFDE